MTTVPPERQQMAKAQKSLLLNEEVARLVEAYQKTSGLNFTRTVTASLLQAMLSHPRGLDNRWVQIAVALENEEMTLESVIEERLDRAQKEHDWHVQIDDFLHAIADAINDSSVKDSEAGKHIAALRIEADKMHHPLTIEKRFTLAGWIKIAQNKGKDIIDRLVTHWQKPVDTVGYGAGIVSPDEIPTSYSKLADSKSAKNPDKKKG